ncbi:uncharacterized protein UV8b_03892 [Ustilaginoidea virens]|nr:uncharacterized protein UV8b_03892 [Ustilaginoidea virens]QUC19651.1 hypothetical protein UV8b_03892 [Ustilaginoidea virens]
MFAAALAVLLAAAAAAVSPAAARDYAPGKRNICVKENGTGSPILWTGKFCKTRNGWPSSAFVGNVEYHPPICCYDMAAYGSYLEVIQGSAAACAYADRYGVSMTYITKVPGRDGVYDITVANAPYGTDTSKTPGRYICKRAAVNELRYYGNYPYN